MRKETFVAILYRQCSSGLSIKDFCANASSKIRIPRSFLSPGTAVPSSGTTSIGEYALRTTLPVIDGESRRAKKEYLWVVRSVIERKVFFHYDDGSRSEQTAEKLLKPFKGYLRSDGYSAYNVFEGKAQVCLTLSGAYV